MIEAYMAATGDKRTAQIFADKVYNQIEAARKWIDGMPYNEIENKII